MLNYSSYGRGLQVVFLHGFCENKDIWIDLATKLSKSYQVITIDLPGFGASAFDPLATRSIDNMAKSVLDTLHALNINQAVIIGHSLGGYVALSMAKQNPKFIMGLGLVHSTAFEDSDEKKETRNKTAKYVLEHGVKSFIEPFVPGLFFIKRRKELQKEIEKLITMGLNTSVETIVAVTFAMRDRESSMNLLQSIDVPCLFIIGKEDTAVTFDKSLEQCHLPKKSMCLFLQETGHQGMYERPQECLAAIEGFLQLC